MATNTFTRYTQKNVGTSAVAMVTANAATQTTVIGLTASNTTSSPVTFSAYVNESFSATGGTGGVSSTTLTITAVASGVIMPNQVITGTGISGTVTIVNQLTSTGTALATIAYASGGASGTNTVTLANVTGVAVGQLIAGTNVPGGTTVLSINTSTNTITLSSNFTGAASGNYSFYATGGVGTYTMSSAQTVANATAISSNTNFYIVNGATIPVGGSLALFGSDGKLVLNTNDAFTVIAGTAASVDVILSCLQIS